MPPGGEPDEDRYDALLGAFNNALRRLLRTPAPDLPALATKFELTIDHEAWELTGGEPCLAALKADARRFAGSRCSVTGIYQALHILRK